MILFIYGTIINVYHSVMDVLSDTKGSLLWIHHWSADCDEGTR